MSLGFPPACRALRAAVLSALATSVSGQALAATPAPPPPSPAASATIDERTRQLAEGPMKRILAAGSATAPTPVVVRVTPSNSANTAARTKPAAAQTPPPTQATTPETMARPQTEPSLAGDRGSTLARTEPPTLPAPEPTAAAPIARLAEPPSSPSAAPALPGEAVASLPPPNTPRLLHTEPIELPESISRRLRGPVDLNVELMISEAGQVTLVNLPQVPFPALRAPVAAALKEWQFAPMPTPAAHRLTIRLAVAD